MKNFLNCLKNFFKKPLNIVAVVVTFLGVLGMILTACVPGKTYYGTFGEDEEKAEVKIVLEKNEFSMYQKLTDEQLEGIKDELDEEEQKEYLDGAWYNFFEAKLDYKIKDGKVLIIDEDESTAVATINGFKLVLSKDEFDLELEEDLTLTNKLAVAFFVVSCVFLVAGAAWIVYSTVFNKKKEEKKPEVKAAK